MNARLVWIIVVVVLVIVAAFVGMIATFAFALFGLMDRSDAHVCGMAAVQRSSLAVALVGKPIAQRGLTGGSTNDENGELTERVTFTVAGPSGQAFVEAQGHRSPLESHLRVRIGREGRSETIYDGPFDCPEIHRK